MFPYVGGVPSFFPSSRRRGHWVVREALPGVWLSGVAITVRARFPLCHTSSSSSTSSSSRPSTIPEPPSARWISRRRSLRGWRRRSDSGGRAMWLGRPREREPVPIQTDCLWEMSVESVLRRVDSWDFDVFQLERVSGGRPVLPLGVELFRRHNLMERLGLDGTAVVACLRRIEESYSGNPYHNAIHAADVGQSMHCLLLEASVGERLSPLEILACLLAAFGHDIFHPGLNQAFLTKSAHFLAGLYHGASVLEHFHYHCLLSILAETQLLRPLPPQHHFNLRLDLKRLLERMVLATDMQMQRKYIDQFQVFLRSPNSPHIRGDAAANCELMQILIKCADINNPCRRWSLSRQWSRRATHEFFAQDFMENVASQLFVDWDRFMGTRLSTTMMRNLLNNVSHWKEEEALATAPVVEEAVKEDSPARLAPPPRERRRVSASAIYAKTQRKLSGKWSRRVSMPVSVASTTTWTIRTPLRTMRTTSRETLSSEDSNPITLHPPIHELLSPLTDVAESPGSPGDSPRITLCQRSPFPPATPEEEPSEGPPMSSRRRFSEPAIVCASDSAVLAAALSEWSESRGYERGRRGSLPLHFHSPLSSKSSGSQPLQIVGAF